MLRYNLARSIGLSLHAFPVEMSMLAPQKHPVYYPESDGKPMAETDVHRNLIIKMVDLLQEAYPEAYVSGNICLYYEEGNPKKMISPDALLCSSQPPGEKRVYLAWEEEAPLDLVMEFSSRSTHREDHHKKKRIYEHLLKVPYYVIFNPHVVYLNVFALEAGEYRLLETNEQGCFPLEALGLQVAIEHSNSLRLFDGKGRPVLTRAEREAKRADQEAKRAEQAIIEKEEEKSQKEGALAEQKRLRALLKSAGIDPDTKH